MISEKIKDKDIVLLKKTHLLYLHPEVKYVSLLTLLYAGTTTLLILNTPSFIDIVKKLKQRGQSAGNKFNLVKFGTSETLCDEIVFNENIKPISEHVPKHLRPANDEQFGHYIAGLIDGDGHFSTKQQLVIVFDVLSAPLAYYLKRRIGDGNVKKVKDKNAYLLIIASFKGLEKVVNLINNKIRSDSKLDQINNNILNHKRFTELKENIIIKPNISKDLMNNHWLAGFSDSDASFQIKLINRKDRTEVRLNYQIDQKKVDLLLLIKDYIGGNIGYRKSQDTYYYGSTSFGSAKNVINYFNKFQMLSNKHVNYLKWRKAYLIIQDKYHLNENGLNKITKLKNTMNRLN